MLMLIFSRWILFQARMLDINSKNIKEKVPLTIVTRKYDLFFQFGNSRHKNISSLVVFDIIRYSKYRFNIFSSGVASRLHFDPCFPTVCRISGVHAWEPSPPKNQKSSSSVWFGQFQRRGTQNINAEPPATKTTHCNRHIVSGAECHFWSAAAQRSLKRFSAGAPAQP